MKICTYTGRAIRLFFLVVWLFCVWACQPDRQSALLVTQKVIPEQLDFNFHVKPILSDRCFACHGPDANARKANLRLDTEAGAFAALTEGEGFAIVAGNTHESELVRRILTEDPEQRMPPPESEMSLSEEEKQILINWIAQGANWKDHWSFLPLKAPPISVDFTGNPIDYFIQKRLALAGLALSPQAEKRQLLRRLSFDLIGLPPTPEELEAFLADPDPDSYEKQVDRLLESPRYGERMAVDWLDIARFADSHGFHADGYRRMWPWRDWVIQAFNDNIPYDQFAAWQLAGDLLPQPSQDQVLATGFHRNNPINSEAGIVPEEYRMENVIDRTNTTAKTFLGLTLECARCHDHKYDPVSQKEYFQLAAYFNSVDELGMVGNDGSFYPTIPLMSEKVAAISSYLQTEIDQQEQALNAYALQARKHLPPDFGVDANSLERGLVGYYPLDHIRDNQALNAVNPETMARLRGPVEVVPGWKGTAVRFDSEYESLDLMEMGNFERYDEFSMGCWVYPEKKEAYTALMGNSGHKNAHWRGYEMYLDVHNRVHVRLVHELPGHAVHVFSHDSIPISKWTHVLFTYDGSSQADGIHIYLNGTPVKTMARYDNLYKSIRTIGDTLKVKPRPLRAGRSHRFALDLGLLEGSMDELRVYERELSEWEVAYLVEGMQMDQGGGKPIHPDEKEWLASHFIRQVDSGYQKLARELKTLRVQAHEVLDTVPEIMVMQEMDAPRPTFVLDRGMYDAPTEEVYRDVPAMLAGVGISGPQNRLGLVQWLFDPQHPLTARVVVNRFWYMLFGRGLVHTLEDFGNQGALPSHPELLDWLALSFQQSGWDVKALLRMMVTSATYRQTSVASPLLREMDPDNVLLARGPSYRLSAEMVRDNALHASGVLEDKLGGPSVRTYQPEGIWGKTHFSRVLNTYEPDTGRNLYRRSLYTFIRRTAPPPSMTVFDASDRSMCIVRRQATSTPLQALLLLNEPQLLEAARILAERVLKKYGDDLNGAIEEAYLLLTSQELSAVQLDLSMGLYEAEYQKYLKDPEGAQALLSVGDYPRDLALALPQVAAMTVLVNMMMNYDTVYTKR